MGIVDHARLRARLFHDGVGEVLARGAVQVGELELAREADLAVCIVLRGVEHVAGSVLQVEGELAVRGLRRVVEAVRNLDGLGRRQDYGTLCVVGVVEGGSRSGTVIGDGHLRLVVVALVLLYLDVDLDFLGVVGHAVDGLAGFLLLERVVVLAQVQVLDGQLVPLATSLPAWSYRPKVNASAVRSLPVRIFVASTVTSVVGFELVKVGTSASPS